MGAPVLPALAGPTPAAPGTEANGPVIGPDMTELQQRFPPRPAAATWPAIEQSREPLLARLLGPPVSHEDDWVARQRRRLGLTRLLDWLTQHPGGNWQQRWLAGGADAAGNADWWPPLLAWGPETRGAGASTASNLRVCALLLVGADVIRPSLE